VNRVSKIKYFFQQSWLLIAASFFFGILLAVTSAALSPRIEQNKINKRNALAGALLPQARNFVSLEAEIDIESVQGQKEEIEVFKAVSDAGEVVGWCFNAAGPGFADRIELVVAVDENFQQLAGFNVLASNETPGFGNQIRFDFFRDQFKGAPAEDLRLVTSGDSTQIDSEIVAISGATISSEAVVDIIGNAVPQIEKALRQKGLIGNDR
jgi:electron transport complex protein RnfG